LIILELKTGGTVKRTPTFALTTKGEVLEKAELGKFVEDLQSPSIQAN